MRCRKTLENAIGERGPVLCPPQVPDLGNKCDRGVGAAPGAAIAVVQVGGGGGRLLPFSYVYFQMATTLLPSLRFFWPQST